MNKRIFVILVVATYLIMLIGGGILKPGYSHVSQYISELNATGSMNATFIGWIGFMPFGIASLLLLIICAPLVPLKGAGKSGYWLLMAEPIAYIGSTFAPCDLGCPAEGSVTQMIHNALGFITYLATTIGLVMMGSATNIPTKWRITIFSLAVIWFSFFSMMLEPEMVAYRGLLQRLAEWIVYGVLLGFAWNLLGKEKQLAPNRPENP